MLVSGSTGLLLAYYFGVCIATSHKPPGALSVVPRTACVLWDWFRLILPLFSCTSVDVVVSIAIVASWFATEHWLISNLLTFHRCACTISLIKIRSLQMVLAVEFLAYDV